MKTNLVATRECNELTAEELAYIVGGDKNSSGGSGKVTTSDLHFTKEANSASANLMN